MAKVQSDQLSFTEYRMHYGLGGPHRLQIELASSARWFEGFTRLLPTDRTGPREVSSPRTWLLQTGWQHYGLIDPASVPGSL